MLPNGSEEYTLYGAHGEKLGVFSINQPASLSNPAVM